MAARTSQSEPAGGESASAACDVCPVSANAAAAERASAPVARFIRLSNGARAAEFFPKSVRSALIGVAGAGGGISGPGGLYHTLATSLFHRGVGSLLVDYRKPNNTPECVQDVYAGIEYLQSKGVRKVIVCGWSFGGAVAITSAAARPEIAGAITIASQTAHCDAVSSIKKPILFVHGQRDTCLSYRCSVSLHDRAPGPKELLLLEGDGHCIERSGGVVRDRIVDFVTKTVQALPEA
eukprot:tig00000802_g4290.t1